ncbi:DHA2 family efflux MFS transporter permease subunit [Sphingomonas sp.]|uniref:DHA2 family efflux MFS transporter permease subunit n=1 Tax=Sphingomonas sp. TaxID=28214 RepID=UPI003CC61D84
MASTELKSLPVADLPLLQTSNRALLTIGVMAATIMQILDSTIANVALPHIKPDLGATDDSITWVLTSYIVASAVAIPLTGWLADAIGSRKLFLTSIAGFVAASMLCGLATNLPEMVAFRVLQGVAAAFMNPLSQTVMMDISPPSKQASAMAVWGMGVMVGPILGPVIGGWLTENYEWRWCFYVNVPIGVACFAVLWWLLPSRPLARRRFDLFGFSMLALAISALQVMLDRGTNADWFHSTEIWIELAVAVSAAWMFGAHLVTAREPMFDRALFANRNLVTGLFFMLVVGVIMMASMALLPPMLQNLFGYPVMDTGLLLVPRGVGIVVTMWVAGRLIARGTDPRIMVAVGLVIATITLWQMTGWTLQMGAREFVIVGFVQGLGLGLVFIPLNIMAFATLSQRSRTEGSSLMNLSRNIGASVGISVVTALLGAGIQRNHEELGARLPDLGVTGSDPIVAAITGTTTDQVLAVANGIVNQQAAMIAYLNDFAVMMALTACAIPLVLVLRRPKLGGAPATSAADAMGH